MYLLFFLFFSNIISQSLDSNLVNISTSDSTQINQLLEFKDSVNYKDSLIVDNLDFDQLELNDFFYE